MYQKRKLASNQKTKLYCCTWQELLRYKLARNPRTDSDGTSLRSRSKKLKTCTAIMEQPGSMQMHYGVCPTMNSLQESNIRFFSGGGEGKAKFNISLFPLLNLESQYRNFNIYMQLVHIYGCWTQLYPTQINLHQRPDK